MRWEKHMKKGKKEKGTDEDGEVAPKRCAFFSSLLYVQLREKGYSHRNVRRWSNGKVRVPNVYSSCNFLL